jgi:hypothetical protein
MTPQHGRLLLNALKDNIEKYESKFGEIKILGDEPPAPNFGFQLPTKEEKIH